MTFSATEHNSDEQIQALDIYMCLLWSLTGNFSVIRDRQRIRLKVDYLDRVDYGMIF